MDEVRIVAAGDAALIAELPASIDPATNDRVVAIADAVAERCGATIRDIVIGYCTVTVYFDPLQMDEQWLRTLMDDAARRAAVPSAASGALVEVPVCYGGDLGPDLGEVAAHAAATEDEVVALHAGRDYRVYVVGFVPGFAYMASVDPRLALPRRATPRTRVPALSVAIAAGQTGIYPAETPGGWHVIGRAAVKPFDPTRPEPCLFRTGDRVRFRAVDRDEFNRLSAAL